MAHAIAEVLTSATSSPLATAQPTEAVSFAAVFSETHVALQETPQENHEETQPPVSLEQSETEIVVAEALTENPSQITVVEDIPELTVQTDPEVLAQVDTAKINTVEANIVEANIVETDNLDTTVSSIEWQHSTDPQNTDLQNITVSQNDKKPSDTENATPAPDVPTLSFSDFHVHMFRQHLESNTDTEAETSAPQTEEPLSEFVFIQSTRSSAFNLSNEQLTVPTLVSTQPTQKRFAYGTSLPEAKLPVLQILNKTFAHEEGVLPSIIEPTLPLNTAATDSAIRNLSIPEAPLASIPLVTQNKAEFVTHQARTPQFHSASTFTDNATQLSQRFQIVKQIEARIQILRQHHKQQIQIQLEPAHLGKIKLQLQQEGQLFQLHILAESALTRELLESQMQQLKQQFSQMGFELSDVQVNQENPQRNPTGQQQNSSHREFYTPNISVPLFSLMESDTAPQLSYGSSNITYYHQVNYLA